MTTPLPTPERRPTRLPTWLWVLTGGAVCVVIVVVADVVGGHHKASTPAARTTAPSTTTPTSTIQAAPSQPPRIPGKSLLIDLTLPTGSKLTNTFWTSEWDAAEDWDMALPFDQEVEAIRSQLPIAHALQGLK